MIGVERNGVARLAPFAGQSRVALLRVVHDGGRLFAFLDDGGPALLVNPATLLSEGRFMSRVLSARGKLLYLPYAAALPAPARREQWQQFIERALAAGRDT
jgi:hypothetical protein